MFVLLRRAKLHFFSDIYKFLQIFMKKNDKSAPITPQPPYRRTPTRSAEKDPFCLPKQ